MGIVTIDDLKQFSICELIIRQSISVGFTRVFSVPNTMSTPEQRLKKCLLTE